MFIKQIINFINSGKINVKNITIHVNAPTSKSENMLLIQENTYVDNKLFMLNEVLNHIRNYRKITPEIAALIETMSKEELIHILHISMSCTDNLVETFI
jgi:hypothetical protein